MVTVIWFSGKARYAASILREGKIPVVIFKVEDAHIMCINEEVANQLLVYLPEFYRDPEDFEGFPTLTSKTMKDFEARGALRGVGFQVEIKKW